MDEKTKAPDRVEVLKRIDEYERIGKFNVDIEDDPPSRPIKAGEVDYSYRRLSSKLSGIISTEAGRAFYRRLERKKAFILKAPQGVENMAEITGGAIVTCNHFNLADNYALVMAIKKYLPMRRRLFRIIREGNYTGFDGLFGYLFRHCYTLPIPSDRQVLREMRRGIDELLLRGEKILIYPEQCMWWNYRKPRPFKDGAFYFAAKAGVPIIPCFVTLADSDIIGDDGFPVQEYTVHVMPAIYPDPDSSVPENTREMCRKNYELVCAKYEEIYGIPVKYLCDGE